MSNNLNVANGPIPTSSNMLGGSFASTLLVSRCASCGDFGSDMSHDRGVPFCNKCLLQGALDPGWEAWDDLGGGD